MGSDSISQRTLSFTVLLSFTIFFLFCTEPTLSADSPPSPPPISPSSPQPISSSSPPPISPASPSPAPVSPAGSPPPLSPSPFNSPPAPPPADLAPNSPSPAGEDSPSPSPSQVKVNGSRVAETNASDLESNDDGDGGMSAGKKAGVAIAVIAGVCVVGLGALVYKKRQQNIQRAQYGYAARREFL